MNAELAIALKEQHLWRGRDHGIHRDHTQQDKQGICTGHAELDQQLPTGGWPRGALTEILHHYPGQGELQLLLPTLVRLTQQQQLIALINPPWTPYAPALANAGVDLNYLISIAAPQATSNKPLSNSANTTDHLWALEQSLRSGHCQAVLAWPETHLAVPALRRLQLAAETGQSCGFLFRPSQVQKQHSPAALRLLLEPGESSMTLDIIKCRGRHFSRPLVIAHEAEFISASH